MIDVNFFWVGNSLSTMEKLSLVSHLAVGHRCTLWLYEAINNLPSGIYVADAREIMPENEVFAYENGGGAGSYSACSNLFRYKLLSEQDVWWSDTDVVAMKKFDFTEDHVFASERTSEGSSCPTTCVIKTTRELAKKCYELAKERATDRKNLKWGVIGPLLLGQMIQENALESFVKPPETFCPLDWFAVQQDPLHCSVNSSESHAIHLWHEMWRRSGIDKNRTLSEDSIYERLKKRYLCSHSENCGNERFQRFRYL
jgi:hypothetical protein